MVVKMRELAAHGRTRTLESLATMFDISAAIDRPDKDGFTALMLASAGGGT